jgi:hypothetical protein
MNPGPRVESPWGRHTSAPAGLRSPDGRDESHHIPERHVPGLLAPPPSADPATVAGKVSGISQQQMYLGGTAMLIVVGVALDTMRQLQTQLFMRGYRGFIGEHLRAK